MVEVSGRDFLYPTYICYLLPPKIFHHPDWICGLFCGREYMSGTCQKPMAEEVTGHLGEFTTTILPNEHRFKCPFKCLCLYSLMGAIFSKLQ